MPSMGNNLSWLHMVKPAFIEFVVKIKGPYPEFCQIFVNLYVYMAQRCPICSLNNVISIGHSQLQLLISIPWAIHHAVTQNGAQMEEHLLQDGIHLSLY